MAKPDEETKASSLGKLKASREKKKQQQSSRKLLPDQLPQSMPFSSSVAILPPPDLTSSYVKSINLLVCTANLGNAPPDAESWNAWIPKDGKLVPTTQFPVRMTPPPPPPGQQKKPQAQQQYRNPFQNGEAGQHKPRKPKQKDPSLRKPKREKNSDAPEPEKDGYEAYLDSLKANSYSFDQDDVELKTEWRKEKGIKPVDRKLPRRTHSKKKEKEDESKPTRKTKPEKDEERPQTPTQLQRGVRRSRSNTAASDLLTPRQRRPRSKSIDASKMDENPLSPRKSPGAKSPRTQNGIRRGVRTKSNNLPHPQTPNSLSPRPGQPPVQRNSIGAPKVEEQHPRSPVRKGRRRSNSDGKGSANEAFVNEVPECRKIDQAKITREEVERIKEIEVRYPASAYGKGKPNPQNLGCYDIIVIGMQEATFSTSKKKQGQSADEEFLLKRQLRRVSTGSFDTLETSDSDDDSDANITDDGSILSLTDDIEELSLSDDDAEDGDMKSAKAKKKKKKDGKKRNLLKRITKATTKTAKTIDTFAGGGKNHTDLPLRTSPPQNAGNDDAAVPTQLMRNETLSPMDTDDDDCLDETIEGKGNVKPKKWTDTDVLHHAIECNQLPGYTRALSYQFGQMRLFVYYKPGTDTNDLLQSLDVLSVSYQGTGKAGLANKGGIMAEIAVNKTTRLSFLTAHLEAHEGAKHYRARNESLQDILTETGSSKYFDASLSSHFTFAMGDLNYRTKLDDVAVGSDRHIQFSHNIVDRRDWRILNQFDELSLALANNMCLSGFKTAYCNFPPTFKVDPQQGYMYNTLRSPSYTDRILFKNADKLDSATKLLMYEPVEGFVTSDHKPIRSGFTIRLNRELRWKSTAELLSEDEQRGKMRSIDSLDGILPNRSKGNIDADRETMNIFVTNIECVVDPINYDQLRKQDKANLPNPKVLFITNPLEAIVMDDSGKKRRFGIGSLGGKSSKESAETTEKKKPKYPSTPSSKDTMRPMWRDDHVYFGLRTHNEHGRPIDFTGAQMNISLVDTNTGNSVIGTHCLNLAHLLICSREKEQKQLKRVGSENMIRSDQQGSQRRLGSRRAGSSRRLGSERQGSSRRLASERPASSRRLGGERPASQRRLNGNSNANGQKGSGSAGYQLVHKPSPAMRAAAASAMKFGNNATENSKTLPPAVKKVAGTLHRRESGASKLYDSIMADLGGGGKLSMEKDSLDEFGLRSLRLQEKLIGGGLITGHIKCDIDVWWT